MWLIGLGISAAGAEMLGAVAATGLVGDGVSLPISAGGNGGNALDTETSDDLALTINGLTSSIDAFVNSASGDDVPVGVSSTAGGFGSSLAGGVRAGAETGSVFLSAKTECLATELLLLVLVKNEGLGLAAERRDCPNGAASWTTLLVGFGVSEGACFVSVELIGGCSKALDVEFSEDPAPKIGGLTSSVDFSSGEVCAGGDGFCSSTSGFWSFLIGADAAIVGSGFFKANTECPETELLLLVRVRNEGLGLGAQRREGPIGFGFSFSIARKLLLPSGGEAGTLFSGWKIERLDMKDSPRGLANGDLAINVDWRSI